MTSRPTLGQVLRSVIQSPMASALHLSPHHWKTVRALAACRTSALGGQLLRCTGCQREHFVAHSCRNRHCPQCQGARAVDWLQQQEAALLPIPYFHVVFTLPHTLNGLIRQNRRALFKLLFDAASQTLLEFGAGRLKAQLGLTAVLHTWSQTLLDHYHLHCIVTGGGLSADGRQWRGVRGGYLFPIRALSRVFRAKYRDGLQRLFEEGKLDFHGQLAGLAQVRAFQRLKREVLRSEWVVYAKRPFAGPEQVLRYLSRYTHRVAIGNGRLIKLDVAARTVSFGYKDYAAGSQRKVMTLGLDEFLRRFCLHVLPERFVKIRHYGLLANRGRHERVAQARALLGGGAAPVVPGAHAAVGGSTPDQDPAAVRKCPHCGSVRVNLVEIYYQRQQIPGFLLPRPVPDDTS